MCSLPRMIEGQGAGRGFNTGAAKLERGHPRLSGVATNLVASDRIATRGATVADGRI